MIVLRVIGHLLDYPEQSMFDHHGELVDVLEAFDELEHRTRLIGFIRALCSRPLLDVQADYCELFDRGRATSLLLFEHVHGESRDRGQAMVDLLDQYRADGLELDAKELPDYLPLYLEYLSYRTIEQARDGLQDITPILALLAARLQQRQSQYALLFDALLSLSHSGMAKEALHPQVANEARDDTPAALDAVWEEEQVRFLGEQSCASDQQAQHQRRFAAEVKPQYLDVAQATARSTGR